MGKKQKMTKGTKIYYGIAAVIIMGLMAYNWRQGGLITIVSSFISIIVAAFTLSYRKHKKERRGGEYT